MNDFGHIFGLEDSSCSIVISELEKSPVCSHNSAYGK
jgi:hypothetical protein